MPRWRAGAWADTLAPAVTLLVLAVAATGLVPALRYDPDPQRAHDAVAASSSGVAGLARSFHSWAASVAVALALVHLARRAATGPWPRADGPRWYLEAAAVALLLAGFLTGGILDWDHHGWESLQHAAAGADALGLRVADPEDPAAAPLGALFLVHVLAVPALLVAIFVVLARRAIRTRAVPFALAVEVRAAARQGAPWLGLAALLALLRPPPLGPAPVRGLAVSRPDWPFLWLTPLEDAWGVWGMVLGVAALALAAALLPPWAARASARPRAAVVVALVAVWALLTVVGAVR